jgi:hypothetical protein
VTKTAAELIAERVAPFWLAPEEATGHVETDAQRAMSQRYKKADGEKVTQFNSGALVVRDDHVLALTACRPVRRDPTLVLGTTEKPRRKVVDDVRRNGVPHLVVLFENGAIDVGRWVCCTPDEVVFNGPDGPQEIAAMEDVERLQSLPAKPNDWRTLVRTYLDATAAPHRADLLFAKVAKFAKKTALSEDTVMEWLHTLRHAERLTFDLAAPLEVGS